MVENKSQNSQSETTEYLISFKQVFYELIENKTISIEESSYLKNRWLDQILWFERKANFNKNWHKRLRLTIIILGSLIPMLVGINIGDGARALRIEFYTLAISALLTISQSIEEVFKFKDKWFNYRRSSESLKAIGWEYLTTEDVTFRELVDETEEIIKQDIDTFTTSKSNKKSPTKE